MNTHEFLKQKIHEAYPERPITFFLCVIIEAINTLEEQNKLLRKELYEFRKKS